MSRGPGWLQMRIVELVSASDTMMRTIDICADVFGTTSITPAQAVSVRRALRNLVKTGTILRVDGSWSDRNIRFGTPAIVKAYDERVANIFGRRTRKKGPA